MIFDLRGIGKKFGKNYVLRNVNMSFKSGRIYGLSGRNGTGKSVLLKIICGIYNQTEGKILFNNKRYNILDKEYPRVRALIENPSFFPELTGFENLKLLASIQNIIDDVQILNALEEVNLIDEKDKKFSEYSLGMKQKLGIAQVIMEEPDVIILDEPFNGIEEKTVKKISDYLIKEKEKNKIIIISSHIKDDLTYISDMIYYFDDGTVIKKENK